MLLKLRLQKNSSGFFSDLRLRKLASAMLSASESSEVLCPSDVVAFEDLTIYSSILKRLPTATQFDRHLGVIKYRGRNPIVVTEWTVSRKCLL